MLGVPAMIVSRRTNAQENLEPVTGTAAIIAIEFFWPEIECELSAESDVDLVPVGKIANVTERHCVHGKNFIEVAASEHELMSGFLDALPSAVDCIALALVIGFEQHGFGFAFVAVVVLSPD